MWTDQGLVSSCRPTSTDALRCFSATNIGYKTEEAYNISLCPESSHFSMNTISSFKIWPWLCTEQINELKGMWSSRGIPPFILILKMQNCLNSQAGLLKSNAEKASAIFSSSLKNIPEEGSRHIWEAIFRLLLSERLWKVGKESEVCQEVIYEWNQVRSTRMANPRAAGIGTKDVLTCFPQRGVIHCKNQCC